MRSAKEFNDNGSCCWDNDTYSNELLEGFPQVDYDIDVDNWWYERADYRVNTNGQDN